MLSEAVSLMVSTKFCDPRYEDFKKVNRCEQEFLRGTLAIERKKRHNSRSDFALGQSG